MTRLSFFKANPVTCGAYVGTAGLILGTVATTIVSLKSASYCASSADSVEETINGDINISKVTADFEIRNYSTPVTFTNLNTNIPNNWVNMIDHTINKAPTYCFYVPFIYGLTAVIVASLSMSAIVMVICHIQNQSQGFIRKQQKKPLTITDDYQVMEERFSIMNV